jgi:hypothetical protein
MTTQPATCQGIRKDGRPCDLRIVADSGYCWAHNPAYAEARRRGGQNKARTRRAEKLVPSTLRPVLTTLLDVLEETRRGDLDPKIAGAVASVAGAIVKVYSSATVEQQIVDLQMQIDRLGKRSA